MIVLQNNRLNKEFLQASNLQNNRALVAELFPSLKLRGKTNDVLIDKIDTSAVEVSPDQFRTAMWNMMDGGYKGNAHVSLSAMPEFKGSAGLNKLQPSLELVSSVYGSSTRVETNRPLDARIIDKGDGPNLHILYLGHADAEVYEAEHNRPEVIDGKQYTLRAYRQLQAPVLSMIRIGASSPFALTLTRAIHRGVTPTSEADGLRQYLSDLLQMPFPPMNGISDGIRALWNSRIVARQYNVGGSDGYKLSVTRGIDEPKQSSTDVEDALVSWDLHSGSLRFDKKISFKVDTKRAIFSFGSVVSWTEAQNVIAEIISSIP